MKDNKSLIYNISNIIVEKRNLIFLFVIIGLIFSLFSSNWIQVENKLTEFLPDDSSTKIGLEIMDDEFVTFKSAEVMIANITYDKADEIFKEIKSIEGVRSVTFDQSKDRFNEASAHYTVVFDYDEKDDKCLDTLQTIEEQYKSYDIYIVTSLGNSLSETIDKEVSIIMVYVAIIVVLVLLFVSDTYAEVPVLILTFLCAMILNQGTNFLLGKISFVSNSVTSILQLALSLDYAVILSNRYKEEREKYPINEASVTALTKSIPEISASSLTTIGGLIAMMFMQFKIGPDMAICLIKAIIFALLSVFLIMPGLLVAFGQWMEKTKHKSFLPAIPFVGKFAYKTRKIIPPVFLLIIIISFYFSNKCPYAYGYSNIQTPKLNENQIAENMLSETFSTSNFVALVVPDGNYEKEKELLQELETYEEVDYTMGLVNIEAMNGYMLADRLTPREFAELADLDYELVQLVYSAYAADHEDYANIITNVSTYEVPLIDMFLFVCDQLDKGIITLDSAQIEMLNEARQQMEFAKLQLSGNEYSRMLIYLNLPESGNETYKFIDTIECIAKSYYENEDIFVVGDSTSEYDFKKSFDIDNTIVSIVSILIVLVVLLFTFNSIAMPLLLIVVIQGAIWINFSIPAILNSEIFFMSYLVVSSIQMGANIDYAIVIGSRFNELKDKMTKKEAIIETMNFAFPTIVTSGSILSIAGILIGNMTSDAAIVGIGQSIGRGTIISIILVLFVLPQILLIGSNLVDKTSFKTPKLDIHKKEDEKVLIYGGIDEDVISGNILKEEENHEKV